MVKTIKLEYITKIEGHANLRVKIDKGKVIKAQLEVFEGARFFEGIVKGRSYKEAAIITSRICGVCPVAHQVTSLRAVENALSIKVSEQTRKLRELMLIGQIFQSHILHLFFLALPDYLGYESAIQMAEKHKKKVVKALKLKKLANRIISVIGGREIHPVTLVVGGFSKLPSQEELNGLLDELKKAKKGFIETARLFAKLKYPKFERKTEYHAMSNYNLFEGCVESDKAKYCQKDYMAHLKEYTTPYSTAKFVIQDGKSYMTGALARINLNREKLSDDAKKILNEAKIKFPNYSPYINNFAQALELVHFNDRAIEILKNLKIKNEALKKIIVKRGRGIAASEVPRGLLYHEYEIDDSGTIVKANIIPPTTQNLRNIEDDVKMLLPTLLDKPKDEMIRQLEMLIRAYDPCISCSTHFLKLEFC